MGSPRIGGLTGQMLAAAEKRMQDCGCEVVRINVSELQLTPCRACMRCRQTGVCSKPRDDAHRVAELLQECDGMIVAAPTYLGDIPGETKMLFDRLVAALMDTSRFDKLIPQPLHHKKPIGVIITSTTRWPLNQIKEITDCEGTLRRMFTPAGFRFASTVRLGNTKNLDELKSRDIASAEKMGYKVASKAQIYFERR